MNSEIEELAGILALLAVMEKFEIIFAIEYFQRTFLLLNVAEFPTYQIAFKMLTLHPKSPKYTRGPTLITQARDIF